MVLTVKQYAFPSVDYRTHWNNVYDELLMWLIDEKYTWYPFRNTGQLTGWLQQGIVDCSNYFPLFPYFHYFISTTWKIHQALQGNFPSPGHSRKEFHQMHPLCFFSRNIH